jgi:peptide/nickel transport system permease protein
MLFTIWAVITLSFVLIRFLPGGPLDYLRSQLKQQGIPQETINEYVENYISILPSEPLYVQYFDYMSSVLTLDFGISFWSNEPVFQILAMALPWTIFLMSIATLVNTVLGIIVGGIMAYMEGGKFDTATTITSIILTSIPYYVSAIVLIYILGYQWGWFPTGGQVDRTLQAGFNWPYIRSILYHAALPLISLTIGGWAGGALAMRGNAISVLGEDYVRVARLRGLSRRRIALRYVARNAMLPMYTGILIGIAALLGGSVILEQIFAYPGVGYYLFQAVESRDYPLMMGGLIMTTVATIFGVFVADLTYSKIDPRASAEGDRESY